MAHINKLRVRLTHGHRAVLLALRDGRPIEWPPALRPATQAHRRDSVFATLEKWGAINDGQITHLGRSLLE